MKVPVSWLTSYCDPGWEPADMAVRLAMTGTEVERVTTAGAPDPAGFVIARVTAIAPHPDADRLRVCTVDTGDGEDRKIVCGAPNVDAGQYVAVALPGAVMPGGQKLGRAKLRGVESDGMILSEAELELGEDSDGIAVLATGDAGVPAPDGSHLAPGAPLANLAAFSDQVLELEVTPNRVDCFGIYGVARELHAISGADLAPEPWADDAPAEGSGDVSELASVTVEVPGLCPRFTARAFENVTIGPSPMWLKARLAAAGQRPINNVVDITNYVMLLTAQPLHAFDLDRVPGGELIVRAAAQGEKMTTLDGEERTFDAETVLVCDRDGPSGIAGIMGGQRSEVADDTTRVLLEVATWNPTNILRSSRALALRSEASSRFEKGLHPELTIRAQRIASRLMIELCGATLVPGTIDVHGEKPAPRVVPLRVSRVEELVGLEVDEKTCVERLERLGFGTTAADGVIEATVPPDRDGDVQREADLVEEVARLADLDTALTGTLPAASGDGGGLTRAQVLRRNAEDALCGLGYSEIVAWSFNDPELADRLRLPGGDERRAAIELSNPLSVDQSRMRTLLLGGLLDAARLNLSRGADGVALFESGRVYLPQHPAAPAATPSASGDGRGSASPDATAELTGDFRGDRTPPDQEPHRVGALLTGEPAPSWRGDQSPPDFHTLKGSFEALCTRLGANATFSAAEEPFLAPGRSAAVGIGGTAAGWIGELHPLVARAWDLEGGAAFEIDLALLVGASTAGEEIFEDLTTHPPLHQDLAVVVAEETSAAAVTAAVVEGGGDLLADAYVFDVYRGDQLEAGRKSLALRLSFRAPDRTLTDEEVAPRRGEIAAAIERLGGSLRE